MFFYDILERKNAFVAYKNKKFKNSKNWHFSKRVNPWFWSKQGHFSNFFFLGYVGQENIFLDQNHGLTRLEKCQFFDLFNFFFL